MSPQLVIGDWMGSIYGVGGQRCDWHLFLDHDGRYERSVRREPDYERGDTGRWEYDQPEKVLRLTSDTPDEFDRMSGGWWVLSVTTCYGPLVPGEKEVDNMTIALASFRRATRLVG